MASVNKVILVGTLGRDPEVNYLPSGDAVTNLSIATNSKYKNKAGELIEDVEWHRVSFFGRLAEIAGQYLRKGSQVYIEGSLRTRKWEKDGVTQYATEIRADQMQMLGSKPDGGERQAPAPRQQEQGGQRNSGGRAMPAAAPRQAAAAGSGFDDMDDDIPF